MFPIGHPSFEMLHHTSKNQTSSSEDSDNEKRFSSCANDNLLLQKKAVPRSSTDGWDMAIRSESGSEKESGASRDSDSSASVGCYPLPLKRKENPKSDDEMPSKILFRDSEDTFLQPHSCSHLKGSIKTKFWICRECYKTHDTNQYACRFFSFRLVKWSKAQYMTDEGFAHPSDATEDDRQLWLPSVNQSSNQNTFDFHVARFILSQVGDQFCSLLRQEEAAMNLHLGDDDSVNWKKPMQGVREMCDVCKTTLFNFHWACHRCGFVVCIDCYKARQNGEKKAWMVKASDHDEWKWLHCTSRAPHEQDKLILCQTIAADCLSKLGQLVHQVRHLYKMPQTCRCEWTPRLIQGVNEGRVRELIKSDPVNAIISHLENGPSIPNNSEAKEARVLLELEEQEKPQLDIKLDFPSTIHEDSSSESDDETGTQSGLVDLLVPKSTSCNMLNGNGSSAGCQDQTLNGKNERRARPADKSLSESIQPTTVSSPSKGLNKPMNCILEDVLSRIQPQTPEVVKPIKPMQHFVRRCQGSAYVSHNQLNPRVMTKSQSAEMYPEVPHDWLCNGRLLRLINPSHPGNYRIFQDQWRRGQPVIVGNMTSLLNMDLWHPNSFCKDFGEQKNDLINCATGNLVPNRPMKEFWEGFENFSKRLKDDKGNPMLLKLKDWPPGEDFAELLPERFQDLMQALPLAEYTKRSGRFNLASWLPDFFVRPDLGPKMYNAYGSALFPTKGTTNLHLDISDAVNFMVYVGIPCDADYNQHIEEAYNAIDEAGCDEMTRRRVRLKGEMPGALWHIYHACDADKIRDLLNKVAIERGTKLEPHHDPIHDQNWYLDAELRDRLYKEYDVTGYAIVQCLGDAVFIPAGAPHQVRNLHNCVKVAEDFVSPENVSHCFHLTQEFRDLTDTHSNHEDKLQIKNIIYHTIKSAVSTLMNEALKHE
ncbi:Lysine-specific demethylase 3A [Frankliniella fusca]|uniref:[histone H3]-dimethyl-L-lysine(9) demethylase n=1 Tax=Frankliniella fusca TaxID=407009 RepID=A0AAE1HLU1_9NEOP|nr:Lysine-specific demethylase 3A [Frankliniella fusca]